MKIKENHKAPGIEFRYIDYGEIFYLPSDCRPARVDEGFFLRIRGHYAFGQSHDAAGLETGTLIGIHPNTKVFRVYGKFDVENITELKKAEEATHENQT